MEHPTQQPPGSILVSIFLQMIGVSLFETLPDCALPDAAQPAPQAGAWFQQYFEALIENANPPLSR